MPLPAEEVRKVPDLTEETLPLSGDLLLITRTGSSRRITMANVLSWIASNIDLSDFAPLASPNLTGTPVAPTAEPGTATTQLATTAFVVAAIGSISADDVGADAEGSAAAALALAAGYTDNSISDHESALDPHRDREYVDLLMVDVNASLANKVESSDIEAGISAHAEGADPHGDRAYTDAAIAGLNLFYMGTHASLSALQTAHPTASSGNWAIVDPGAGDPPRVYLWDVDDGWVAGSDTSAANTDGLAEGTVNLYFTAARARAAVIGSASGLLKADGAGNVSAAVAGTDYIAPDDLRTVVNTRTTAAWTVLAGEVTPHGKYLVSVVHSGACTCELPSPTSLSKSPGDKVNIMQGGAGALTITDGAGGATHVGNAVFAAQYEIKTAIALDGTTWLLAGSQ